MKVLVCDDEPLARDRLVRLIERLDGWEVAGEAENGLQAVQQAEQTDFDLVLLDIQMPGMNGIEAAGHLAKLQKPPAVVFCTAYDEYALKAFEVNAVGYLLKPVRPEDLQQVLQKAKSLNRLQMQSLGEELRDDPQLESGHRSHISAKTHRGIELIPLDDVRYFKADQKYVSVRHTGGEVLVDETLKDFEREFGDRFVRVHRNALVSLKHIMGLESAEGNQYRVRFKDIDDRVQVSRRHVAELRETLLQL